MKYFLILLWVAFLVMILVLFFQLLTWIFIQVPMFTKRVNIQIYMIAIILLSFFAGVFLSIGIYKFSSSTKMDDDFDL